MGGLVVQLRDTFDAIKQFKALLDDATILPDATLQGAPISYTTGETTQIRAAFTDLAKLADISTAAATQAATNDFWFNAKHLAGINFH
jgi:hypothetical protein